MAAISRQLEQCAVNRRWYPMEVDCPHSLAAFVIYAQNIPRVSSALGWRLKDAASRKDTATGEMVFCALFEREGGTLEAKRAKEADRLDELARQACVEGVQDESDDLVQRSEGAVRTNVIHEGSDDVI